MSLESGEPTDQKNPFIMSSEEQAAADTNRVVRSGQVVPSEPRVPSVPVELSPDELANRLNAMQDRERMLNAATEAAKNQAAAIEASKHEKMK